MSNVNAIISQITIGIILGIVIHVTTCKRATYSINYTPNGIPQTHICNVLGIDEQIQIRSNINMKNMSPLQIHTMRQKISDCIKNKT